MFNSRASVTRSLGRLRQDRPEADQVCPSCWLVTDRVRQLFTDAGVTGFQIRHGHGAEHWFEVHGSCARPVWSYDSVDIEMGLHSRGTYQKRFVGLPLDESTWDGSGVFRPVGTPLLLMTENVASLVAETGISGWTPEPIQAVGFSRTLVEYWNRWLQD
jgi:hypothetical protein